MDKHMLDFRKQDTSYICSGCAGELYAQFIVMKRHRLISKLYWLPYSIFTLVYMVSIDSSLFYVMLCMSSCSLCIFVHKQRAYIMNDKVLLFHNPRHGKHGTLYCTDNGLNGQEIYSCVIYSRCILRTRKSSLSLSNLPSVNDCAYMFPIFVFLQFHAVMKYNTFNLPGFSFNNIFDFMYAASENDTYRHFIS